MATNLQRSQAICDALINGVATVNQMNRLARALSGLSEADYNALTNAEKAAIIPTATRAWALGKIYAYDAHAAQQAVADPNDTLPENPQ